MAASADPAVVQVPPIQVLHDRIAVLENAARGRDRLLAGMAHELRTPLNAIVGFTGTLLMQLPGPLNAEQQKQLGVVQASARRLLVSINDLLEVARPGADVSSARTLERVDCVVLAESLAAAFRPQAEGRGLRWDMSAAEPGLYVTTDPAALAGVVGHLLRNAMRFTAEGGRIGMRLARGAGVQAGAVVLQVEDTGAGIAAEMKERVFQPDVRSAGVRQQSEGAGLYQARRMARMLGGNIFFHSVEGQGSTFTLELPET